MHGDVKARAVCGNGYVVAHRGSAVDFQRVGPVIAVDGIGAVVIGAVIVIPDEPVIAQTARQNVVALPARNDVVAAVANNGIGKIVAGAVDIAGPGEGQVFDIVRQREAGGCLNLVGAGIGIFENLVAAVIDDIGVVAGSARKSVGARAAIQLVVLRIADQRIVEPRAQQVLDAGEAVAGRVAGIDLGIGQRGRHACVGIGVGRRIDPVAAIKLIAARPALKRVRVCVAGQGIRKAGPDHVLDRRQGFRLPVAVDVLPGKERSRDAARIVGERGCVGSDSAVVTVLTAAADQEVVAGIAVKRVVAAAPGERVVPAPAVKRVVAVPAGERVILTARGDDVTAFAGDRDDTSPGIGGVNRVGARAAVDRNGRIQDIGSGQVVDDDVVVACAAENDEFLDIVDGNAVGIVGSLDAGGDRYVARARPGGNHVVLGSTDQAERVGAGAAIDDIVSIADIVDDQIVAGAR